MIPIAIAFVKGRAGGHGIRIPGPGTACHSSHHIPEHGGTKDFVHPFASIQHHTETTVYRFPDTDSAAIMKGNKDVYKRQGGDSGKPVALNPDSITGQAFQKLAENVVKQIDYRNEHLDPTKRVVVTKK